MKRPSDSPAVGTAKAQGQSSVVLTRRDFIKSSLAWLGIVGLGGAAGLTAGAGGKGTVWQIDPMKCTQCGECVKACASTPQAIKVSELLDVALFTVESTGAIPAERIVTEAFEIMKERFNSIKSEVVEVS